MYAAYVTEVIQYLDRNDANRLQLLPLLLLLLLLLLQQQQQQPFNGRSSGTSRVGRYQKKHSPAHIHPGQCSSFITFLHLQRSTASSLFSLRAWQSSRTTSFQVLFGLPLGLEPSTSYSMHFFTQSSSSFCSTCPYQRSLFCCNISAMSSTPSLSLAAAAATTTLTSSTDAWFTWEFVGDFVAQSYQWRIHGAEIGRRPQRDCVEILAPCRRTAGNQARLLQWGQVHTHPFNGPFSGTTGWAGTRKVLLKQETVSVSGSGISWAICKSAPRSRQITMPAPHHSVFLQAGCPSCRPTSRVKALKASSEDR